MSSSASVKDTIPDSDYTVIKKPERGKLFLADFTAKGRISSDRPCRGKAAKYEAVGITRSLRPPHLENQNSY